MAVPGVFDDKTTKKWSKNDYNRKRPTVELKSKQLLGDILSGRAK